MGCVADLPIVSVRLRSWDLMRYATCCAIYLWFVIEESRPRCGAVVDRGRKIPSLQSHFVADKVQTRVDSIFAIRNPLDATQNLKGVSSAVVSTLPRLLTFVHSNLRDKPMCPESPSIPWRWVPYIHFALVVDIYQPHRFDSYVSGFRI